MRKYLRSISCIFVLVLFLMACGEANTDSNRTEDMTETEIQVQKENSLEETQQEQTEEVIEVTETVDMSSDFQGINGCAVIYLPQKGRYLFYQENMCKQQASPYSTFKIISALSGLQNGVIMNESSKMNYNGTIYGNTDWNGDLTLQEAFQKSCIWYFRQVVDAVGKEKIEKELNSLQYGNCDISEWNGSNINPSEELNGFWLDSSLKISPLEQVEVLMRIFEGWSDYESKHIETLKDIMLADNSNVQKIYGKTGTGVNGEAWFVGFSETDEERKYFAVYLNDNTQKEKISGKKAKEIAGEILKVGY